MGNNSPFPALLKLCLGVGGDHKPHTLRGVGSGAGSVSRSCGEVSISAQRGSPSWPWRGGRGLGMLVPQEVSELWLYPHPHWGTLPGMAAFKCLINIQIYSSHFNLNSMHIIK